MKSASKIVAFPKEIARRNREEAAFLPEALEIVEAPPSPLGRLISLMTIAIFCIALAWACLGRVDIVASASGKIIPTGNTKIVQPYETGVVRAIRVRDGQHVTAGEPLIELDRRINDAERNHVISDLTAAQLDIARLHAALSPSADPAAEFRPPEGASPKLVVIQRQFLIEQVAEHRARIASLERQQAQKEAEKLTMTASIAKLEATIPVIRQRVEIRKALSDQQNGSKLTYLENLQLLIEQQQELNVQKSRYQEVVAALASIVATRAQAEAEYRRTASGELAEAERKAAGLADDLAKVDERTRLQLLTAPVDGIVQQLAVHTIGGVVTPAQQLLVVVPTDSSLEVEAMVRNRDIGFIRVGQDAEIKVDTFNFTRYGLLHGRVMSVSHDAIAQAKPADKSEDRQLGSESASSEPKGQELLYSARVSLDSQHMSIDGNHVDLTPGMAVTVEFKTGSRRLISYLLSPLLKIQHESARER